MDTQIKIKKNANQNTFRRLRLRRDAVVGGRGRKEAGYSD
jgi:hypothetical protein